MEKTPILTDQCLADFTKWASKRVGFNYNKYTKTLTSVGKAFFDIPLPMQHSAVLAFADEHEMCIHIEPYLGGGTPAYIASILYRNKDFIDMQLDVDNSGSAEFWTRFEATEAAVKQFNIMYNANQPNNG